MCEPNQYLFSAWRQIKILGLKDFSRAERHPLFLRKMINDQDHLGPSEVARIEREFDENILSKKKFEVST